MFAVSSNCVWVSICVATIFICLKTDATPTSTLLKARPSEPFKGRDSLTNLNIEDIVENESAPKTIVARSPDSDDNSVDGDDNEDKKTEKPNSEEIFPSDNNHNNHHAHGSHGPLGPVKHLINTVRDRFHGNGEGNGGLHNILGAHHRPAGTDHVSPIETERERDQINSSTGLHVLEFLGTLFGLVWGFLSNIPALFGSSSAGLSGGQ